MRHFTAVGLAGMTYLVGSALNVGTASLNGGRMPSGHAAAPLYWLGDRFAIIGADPGFTRWASIGDFLVWAAELAVALTWTVWAVELWRRRA